MSRERETPAKIICERFWTPPAIGLHVITNPEIYISVQEGQVVNGEIAEGGLKQVLNGWVDGFADWVARLRAPLRAAA